MYEDIMLQLNTSSTMLWVYAAILLLIVFVILLIAPYLGIYGTRNPVPDKNGTPSNNSKGGR